MPPRELFSSGAGIEETYYFEYFIKGIFPTARHASVSNSNFLISYLETHSRLGTVTILSFSGGLIASVLVFVFSVDVSSFIFRRAVVVKFRLISLLSNLIFLK